MHGSPKKNTRFFVPVDGRQEEPSLSSLPVEALEDDFRLALGAGPVVLTAPTGSGKSTVVPCWCLEHQKVLVVQPRRVACRSLARYVSSRFGTVLGGKVGYSIRHQEARSANTELLFVTTGVALRMIQAGQHRQFGTVIVDEFHERSLEIDLIVALLRGAPETRLVLMSATMAGDTVASYLGGRHLVAEGRAFEVSLAYAGENLLPASQGLEQRVALAVQSAMERSGDVLVFLPGKGEIAAAAKILSHRRDLEVLPLHAQLSASEQDRVFTEGDRRRVILATNVAETSVTLPRIGVVIDSGLVRQTRYRGTRGYLSLTAIADDSAEQRRGRAGRLFPGHCLRLWSEAAILDRQTLPEIHREAIPSLVLGAASVGRRMEELEFFDPPKAYAVESATRELQMMNVLDEGRHLTDLGREVASLPLDPFLARIVVEAQGDAQGEGKANEALQDAIDLVAAIASGRAIFRSFQRPDDPDDDLRASHCDATALILALRIGDPQRHQLNSRALSEARRIAKQLRHRAGVESISTAVPDRRALVQLILRAHPQAAYVLRERKGRRAWRNGKEELELGKESAIADEAQAIVVVDTRALTVKARKNVQVITVALLSSPGDLRVAGVGKTSLGKTRLEGKKIVAETIRSYADLVLARDEDVVKGRLAVHALIELISRGKLFATEIAASRERLAARTLYASLHGEDSPPEFTLWLEERVQSIGFESGDDLELLVAEDFLAPDLDAEHRRWLDRNYPRELQFADARYRVDYDVKKREVVLFKVGGSARTLPNATYLPRWPGWRILHRDRSVVRVLREKR